MNKYKNFSILVFILGCIPFLSAAQTQSGARTFFESESKIYVVVMVLTTILIGIFLVLFYLERKLKKLEQDQKKR